MDRAKASMTKADILCRKGGWSYVGTSPGLFAPWRLASPYRKQVFPEQPWNISPIG
jgi:hypothetical protein